MTREDREFIIRALAAHAAVTKARPGYSIKDTAIMFHDIISEFANVAPEPKPPEPKTVRTADGREFLVRDRRAS